MPRNVFENNDAEEEVGLVLEPLPEGYHYEFQHQPNGKIKVSAEKDIKENTELERAFPDTDQYGRHKL